VEVAGGQAVMGGEGVERIEGPAGMIVSGGWWDRVLIEIIACGNGVEERPCGVCRREWQEGDFDRNAQGRLMSTCRLCLVSCSIS